MSIESTFNPEVKNDFVKLVITGVPGTGKTHLARFLSKKLKHPIIEVNKLINEKNLWKVKDEFGAKIARMVPLKKALDAELAPLDNYILEGHLACEFELPADHVVVCRTEPAELEKRLAKRKYPKAKLDENIFAELLDYCTICAGKNYPKKIIIELDTTGKTPKESAEQLLLILKGKKRKKSVDWSESLEKRV